MDQRGAGKSKPAAELKVRFLFLADESFAWLEFKTMKREFF